MNKYKRRLLEIRARKLEIRQQLEGEGEVDLDALNEELKNLKAETEKLEAIIKTIEEALEGTETPPADGEENKEERRADPMQLRGLETAGGNIEERNKTGAASVEYRNAFALYALGKPMDKRSREVFERVNAEFRAAHTTENTAILIPESVVGGIWKRAEEAYPLWEDVRKFAVTGTLTMKKHVKITAGDAAWYDEPTSVVDEENDWAEFTLFGCELAKSVTVSWKLKNMAMADFLPFLEREVGERMGVALGNGVYTGKGKPGASDTFKPEPRGIKTALEAQAGTPQIVRYSTLKEGDLREGVARLHSSYVSGAAWYVNNRTAWTTLAGVQDVNKRSVLLTDVAIEGAVGRVFGMPVKIDASIGDGEILLGKAVDGYVANINREMTMHTEEHVKQRETDYMGYAIVDGDVFDEKAFALLVQE